MSSPSGRAAFGGAGMIAALVVAWLFSPLAIAVVWPLYLVVPGSSIVALLAPRIDLAGRIGLAIVGSVLLSTHLVHLLSHLAGGYGRAVVFAAAAILAIPPVVLLARSPRLRLLRPPAGSTGGCAVAAIGAIVVGGVLGFSLWRVTPEGVTSGGANWSDLGVHLSIAQTLNAGAPFPPDVPYFAGEPLVYHWFADLHAAALASAAGIFAVPAMVLQSTVLAAALALLAFSLARRLVRGHRARRVATLAALLVVLGGGMGWIRLIGDVSAGHGAPLELISQRGYDSQWLTEWPYFRIPSVMGTGLLVHRATTAGLPMLVGAVLLLVAALPSARSRLRGWRDRPALIGAAGGTGALLAPFHFFYFPLVPLLALAWVVAGGRLLDRRAPRNALLFLGPYALAVPFVLGPALQATGSGALELVQVWATAPRDDGPLALAFFYVTNLGVPFLLAIAALVAPRVPHRAFLAAWVLGGFAIPNLVQVSVIDFDMNKVFQAMWIAVAVLAGWLLARAPWPAVAVALALSLPSPLLAAAWTATSNLQVLTRGELAAGEWAARHTPPDAIFVTDGWVNALTDAAGRRRLTTFTPYIANLGYAPDERVSHVITIYCGGDPELSARLMRDYRATHVVDGARPSPCPAPVDFGAGAAFELAYDGSPRIWRLRD